MTTQPPGGSTIIGAIAPQSALPLSGVALDTFFQGVLFGMLGWQDSSLVRPRWQPIPPFMPEANVDWCAVGTTQEVTEGFPMGQENLTDNNGNGSYTQSINERVEVEVSFYGPNSVANANVLKMGFSIGQNRDLFIAQGFNFTECNGPQRVPENINAQWVDRADLTIVLMRSLAQTYDIETLTSASGTVTGNPALVKSFQTRTYPT